MLKGQRTIIRKDDEGYPQALAVIDRPPENLFIIGDPKALVGGLGIVGARKATPYGLGCARRFARIAAEKGIPIVSGGARGCDSAAHRAALIAGGPTVVFLGGGCDRIYPREHERLFQQIVDAGGAVVSENPWEFDPLPYTFRERNRLIAGLSDVLLIVEAGLPSGTFSTADCALDAGKEVLVVPGSITSPNSRGSNRLLAQGATPIVDDDTFEQALFSRMFALQRPEGQHDETPDVEDPVILAIMAEPIGMDSLHELARSVYGEREARTKLMEALVEYEAKGAIARYASGKWGPAVKP